MKIGSVEWYFACIQKAAVDARKEASLMYHLHQVDEIDRVRREIAQEKYLAMIGPMDPWPKQLRRSV